MDGARYGIDRSHPYISFDGGLHKVYAYQLHDLLSRPFCEAMAPKCKMFFPEDVSAEINNAYYHGGLPAVEKALTEMMEESCKKN